MLSKWDDEMKDIERNQHKKWLSTERKLKTKFNMKRCKTTSKTEVWRRQTVLENIRFTRRKRYLQNKT
jgi:hypothetical protein